MRLFNLIGLVWTDRVYDDIAEVVIVRDREDFLDERFTLRTPKTAAVKFMRTEVHDINR